MALKSSEIYVIGHKNPDTDSICSAICYANLKNRNSNTNRYVPMRAGELNEETKYVLARFGVRPPTYVDDISPKLGDIEINNIPGVDKSISIREAWEIMREKDAETLPIIDEEGKLLGIITNEDIARSYMETTDSRLVSEAGPEVSKIAQTVGGQVICWGDGATIVNASATKTSLVAGNVAKGTDAAVVGNAEAGTTFTRKKTVRFDKGKVLVAAADIDYMSEHIEPGDMVILGNREELQLRAIERGAKILIVCTVANVSENVLKAAEAAGVIIICVEKDTYTVTRLVGQSMPISYFMMSENVQTFGIDEWIEFVRDIMVKKRFKYFPVLDKKGKYVGLVSRRNVIMEEKRKLVLVDHNEKSQAVDGVGSGEIVEIIDHHKIGAMETSSPIQFRNQPLGCTATIIMEMYEEERVAIPKQIAGLLLSAILSDTLMFRSPTSTLKDQKAAERLARIAEVDITELAMSMFKAGSNFGGKEIQEIFFQDFKKFTTADYNYGVGQVNILTREDAEQLKKRVQEYLKNDFKMQGFDMVFFLLTNIMEESSELIFAGERADDFVHEAFDQLPVDNCVTVPGLVSRKKQFLPPIMAAMQS